MFFGCIPVATSVSCIPWMLNAPQASRCENGTGSKGGAQKTFEAQRGILVGSRLQVQDSKLKVQSSRFNVVDFDTSETNLLDKLVQDVEALISDQEKMNRKSRAAQEWSQEYTLEKFEAAIREVLHSRNETPQTDNPQLKTDNPQLKTENRHLTTDNRNESITINRQFTSGWSRANGGKSCKWIRRKCSVFRNLHK